MFYSNQRVIWNLISAAVLHLRHVRPMFCFIQWYGAQLSRSGLLNIFCSRLAAQCFNSAALILTVSGPSSVVGIATGYGLDGPGIESRWGRNFQHLSRPALGSFPGVKSGRGVTLTPQPLLVPWPWKGRAVPLLSLGAIRPVQSLSACARVHFTFYIDSNV